MKIFSAFLLTLMFILTGCGNTSSVEDAHADTSKYLRVATASDSSNVPVAINKYVMLVFSAAIDESTVDASSVYIADENNVPISAALTVTEKTVSIIPNEFFLPNKPYTVVVTTTVEDIESRTLENTFTFPFLTASAPDYTPPILLSVTPADGTSADKTTDIMMVFNEVISNGGAVLKLTNSDTNAVVSGKSTVNNNTMQFVPSTDLTPGTNYTVTVLGPVTDLAGNIYTGPRSWSFSVFPVSDLIAVSLSYSGKVIRVEFSEHLDPLTVSESDFAINEGSITFDDWPLEDETAVEFIADTDITGTEEISVSGTIKDIYGNSHNNGVATIYTLGEEI